MNLIFNNVVIESRASDNFVNATQLCNAGGKLFGRWYSLKSTKELIRTLEKDLMSDSVVDVTKGRRIQAWIHPDLAIQLARWVSPRFALQVSRLVRELFITGVTDIDSIKTDKELKKLADVKK
jgi:hypothetical protein